ncbi:hypothetical protein RIF29_12118 [Crotalaria pallida]|uniref:Uncharacterized protein n=1 Tax=Crotalaria pallida TaxID=3830 RepID=A0AAN9P1V3_CROPI
MKLICGVKQFKRCSLVFSTFYPFLFLFKATSLLLYQFADYIILYHVGFNLENHVKQIFDSADTIIHLLILRLVICTGCGPDHDYVAGTTHVKASLKLFKELEFLVQIIVPVFNIELQI